MKLELKITDDNGNVVVHETGPAQIPIQWKAPPGHPVIIERGNNNGAYLLFSVTVAPVTVLNLNWKKAGEPNGRPIPVGTPIVSVSSTDTVGSRTDRSETVSVPIGVYDGGQTASGADIQSTTLGRVL